MTHFTYPVIRTFFVVLLFLSSTLVGAQSNEQKDSPIKKYPKDTNEYRVLVLENGFELVLVHSKTAETSSVSIGVDVGAFHDPEGQSGIAHFLEHMIFLKSKKYPELSGFGDFIQSKGGWSNGFTTGTETVYIFEAPNDALEEGLDRLAAGLKDPIFDINYVQKEINAVDSEWRLKKENDHYVHGLVQRQLLNPSHPAHRFGSGNRESLSAHKPEELLANLESFHSRYYSAAIMRASIYSSLSLDELEKIAAPILKQFINTPVDASLKDVRMLTRKQLNRRVFLKSNTSGEWVNYIFPFKEKQSTWEDHPDFITAKLLTSMHEGGLIDTLRKQGLIHKIDVNSYKNKYDSNGSVEIIVQYTETGRAKEAEVVHAVFDYVKAVKKSFLTEAYVESIRKQLRVELDNAHPPGGIALTNYFVTRNKDIDISNSLVVGFDIKSFNKKAILRRLNAIDSKNVIVIDNSKHNTVDEPIKYTDQMMRVEKEDLKKRVKRSDIKMEFSAPKIQDLISEYDEHHQFLESPQLVHEGNGIEARLMHSKNFQDEKGKLSVVLRSSLTSAGVDGFVHSHVLHNLLHKENQALSQQVYERFNLNMWDKNNNFAESDISISGPTQNQYEVLSQILDTYTTVDITQAKIDIEVIPYVQAMEGMEMEGPLGQAYIKRADIFDLYPSAFSAQERIDALNKITEASLKKFRDAYLKAAFIDVYAYGNYTEEQVVSYAKLATEKLGKREGDFVRLAKGREYDFSSQQFTDISFDIATTGLAFALEFIHPKKSLEIEYQARILAKLMYPEFFKALRTEKKLAYNLGVYSDSIDGHPSLTMYIHSNVADFKVIGESSDTFIEDFGNKLKSLKNDDISDIKATFSQHLLKVPGNIYEEASPYFGEWSVRPEQFHSVSERVEALEAVSAEDVVALFNSMIVEEKSERYRWQVRGSDFLESDFLK